MLGPWVLYNAMNSGGFGWAADFLLAPQIMQVFLLAVPVITALAGIGLRSAIKKYPEKLSAVRVLAGTVCVGLLITLMKIAGILPINKVIYTIVINLIMLLPFVALPIIKRKKKPNEEAMLGMTILL